jgi:regulator of cell morphogenesis and NO signaling
MIAIKPTVTLGELVARRPALGSLFERLGLDYCCAGEETLSEACERHDLDPQTLARTIRALDQSDAVSAREDVDWRSTSIDQLCEHIVAVHHDRLRRELPQIGELLDSMMRVHAPAHPELRVLPPAFAPLCDRLRTHIEVQERMLFPALRALDDASLGAGGPERIRVTDARLAAHERDDHELGELLARIRDLTDDYSTEQALCRTHQRLLDSLRALERDTQQHIHEESNILFPRVRATVSASCRRM